MRGIRKTSDNPYKVKMSTRQDKTGFTLLELIGAIAVIAILMGILLPAAMRSTSRIYIHRAKTQMAALETALSMYYQDWGTYPPTATGPSTQYNGNGPYGKYNLVNALTTTLKGGPYIKFKVEDLLIEAETIYFLDPWGKAFVYTCAQGVDDCGTDRAPWHNTTSYDLYSFGPDRITRGRDYDGADDANCACEDPQSQHAFDDPLDGAGDGIDSRWSTASSSDPGGIYRGWNPGDSNDDDINNWSTK